MTKLGAMAACKHCSQDIQYMGVENDWRDRGNNRRCCVFVTKDGRTIRPKTLHAPIVPVRLTRTAVERRTGLTLVYGMITDGPGKARRGWASLHPGKRRWEGRTLAEVLHKRNL